MIGLGKWRDALPGCAIGLSSPLISLLLSLAIAEGGYLAPDIAELLFPALIQVNATLIGFWGIVFVYSLKSIGEQRRYLHKLRRNAISRIEQMTLKKENLNDHEKEVADRLSVDIESFHNLMMDADDMSRGFTGYGIGVVASFIASILLCILSLGKMDEAGVGWWYVFLPLSALMMGVGYSFYGVWATSPESLEVLENQYIDRKG